MGEVLLPGGFEGLTSRGFGPAYGSIEVGSDAATKPSTGIEVCDILFTVDEPTRHRLTRVLDGLGNLRDVLRRLIRYRDDATAAVEEVRQGIEQALEAAEQLEDPKLARRARRALGEDERGIEGAS